ncbi:hypothetical protein LshimejAT787_0900220 [Lyophyllum shimeji]|uniref:Uncharacterized protein n=1 Tax=Lyophyllum shimeji TaxID=47721 RepID=A0A9P3PQH9_LYOSH|nr:hypothetical protein LshimejAT787_0900220 [Lyophyllum shimeji]
MTREKDAPPTWPVRPCTATPRKLKRPATDLLSACRALDGAGVALVGRLPTGCGEEGQSEEEDGGETSEHGDGGRVRSVVKRACSARMSSYLGYF